MKELLQKLLEAEVLTADTKNELETAINTHVDEIAAKRAADAEADVRANLTEQWVTERDALIEAVDSKVNEFLGKEISELKNDIEQFRDLEAEHAEKLVEAKAQMASELKGDLKELIEKLDSFLEIRLTTEIEELREDITEVRKLDFGRRVFEAFVDEYMTNHADPESAEGALRETQEKLDEAEKKLADLASKLKAKNRFDKMKKVLSPLKEGSRHREVMEAILTNVETEQLEEAYKTFIPRVLKEAAVETKKEEKTTEKETPVLAEGEDKTEKTVVEKVVTGDDKVVIEEAKKEEDSTKLSAEARTRLRRMAGIN